MKPTPEQTAEALDKSIEHWQRLATGQRLPGEGIGSDDCALCDLFYLQSNEKQRYCVGCPVSEATRLPTCYGSPWVEAFTASKLDSYYSPEFLAAAQKELLFLESLRKPIAPSQNENTKTRAS